jgi:hypothetical protein
VNAFLIDFAAANVVENDIHGQDGDPGNKKLKQHHAIILSPPGWENHFRQRKSEPSDHMSHIVRLTCARRIKGEEWMSQIQKIGHL